MSDIRFNNWKHQSGTGGVSQNSGGNVGIGSTLPSSKLDVGGDGKFTGVVTATSFKGDGSQLTGIDASALSFGGSVKVQANASGAVVTGIITGDGSGLTGIAVGLTTEALVKTNGQTASLDLSKDDHKVTATGTVTINVTGGSEGDSHSLRIENSGTANVGFSTYFKFPSGATPSLPSTGGAISLISFTVHKAGSVGIATVLLAGASVNFS